MRGDHITLAANDNYWGGRPQIDQAIIRVITDNAARFFELQAGNIDMMEFPNPDDIKVAQGMPDLQVLFRPSLNVAYIDFNQFRQPFNDVRVRQALSEAINRQRDRRFAVRRHRRRRQGDARAGHARLQRGHPGRSRTTPQHAKQLLADAGYANGFTTDFWYMPVDRPYYPNPQAIAQACATTGRPSASSAT